MFGLRLTAEDVSASRKNYQASVIVQKTGTDKKYLNPK